MELDKVEKKYCGIYRGIVIDNNDPSQYGRIRVKVLPMFDGVTATDLPWAVPAYPIKEGAGTAIGNFAVPDNNTHVFVFFEAGDIYQPVYMFEAPTATLGLPSERTTNYPNRKVLKTRSGFLEYFDETAKKWVLQHPKLSRIELNDNDDVDIIHRTGSFLRLRNDGNVYVYSVKNIEAHADDDLNIHANGHIHVTADNENAEVNPVLFDVTGNIRIEATGYLEVQTASRTDITAGANSTIQVSGDSDINATGDVNITAGGQVDINAPAVNIN